MPVARDIPGAVFREGAAILLARIVDAADMPPRMPIVRILVSRRGPGSGLERSSSSFEASE